MRKADSKRWLMGLAACALASSVFGAGCGKSGSSASVEAGAGGAIGGQLGGLDVGVPDLPLGSGGGEGGAGGAGAGGLAATDAPVAVAGRMGTGGIGEGGQGGTVSASGGRATGVGGMSTVLGGERGGAVVGGIVGSGGSGGVADSGGQTISGGASGGAGGRTRLATFSNTGGRADAGAVGGAGGSTDAGAKQDLPPGTIWTKDWEVPMCSSNFTKEDCRKSSTSICVRGDTYDAYLCSSTGRWERSPDDCPSNYFPKGKVCTGQYSCYYPVFDYCTCSAKDQIATCVDIYDTGLLNPPDAGAPPPDTNPPPVLACPSDMQAVTCDPKISGKYCSMPNSLDVCLCVSGKWTCSATPCPTTLVPAETTCDTTKPDVRCLADDGSVCNCFVTGTFVCGTL
jgi:hypothetical protein